MKRIENLLERVADPDNIRMAAWKAAKGKRYNPEVTAWFSAMETNVPLLREQILSGRVQVGAYRYFKVYEPKERQICASAFSEQVLHHANVVCCPCLLLPAMPTRKLSEKTYFCHLVNRHRARTASTAAAAGTTMHRTAAPRIATTGNRTNAMTILASALLFPFSSQESRNGVH